MASPFYATMIWAKAQVENNDETAFLKPPAVEKTKPRANLWYPDLDSLMVALSLHEGEDNDTLSLSSSESSDLEEKGVRFGSIEIREYQVIRGEHPFCKDGLAMSLGWNYKQTKSIKIDELDDELEDEDDETFEQESVDEEDEDTSYEQNIDFVNTRPKRLNYFERRLLLEQVGYKVEDCYGDIRSSIWLCVDEELPPVDDEDGDTYEER
jgi:hypothetical protein